MSKSFDIALTNRGFGIYDSVRHDYIAKQSLKISKYSEASLFVFGFRLARMLALIKRSSGLWQSRVEASLALTQRRLLNIHEYQVGSLAMSFQGPVTFSGRDNNAFGILDLGAFLPFSVKNLNDNYFHTGSPIDE